MYVGSFQSMNDDLINLANQMIHNCSTLSSSQNETKLLLRVVKLAASGMNDLRLHDFKVATKLLNRALRLFRKGKRQQCISSNNEYKISEILIEAKLAFLAGVASYRRGSFNRSITQFLIANEIFNQTLGNHVNTSESLINLGYAHRKLGLFSQAVEYLRNGIDMMFDLIPPLDENIASSVTRRQYSRIAILKHELGQLMQSQGMFEESIAQFTVALSIRRTLLKPKVDQSEAIWYIGIGYYMLGDKKMFVNFMIEYVSVFLETASSESCVKTQYASSILNQTNQMANFCMDEGFHNDTIFFLQKALYVYKELTKDLRQASVVLWNMHVVYDNLSDKKHSLTSLLESIAVRQQPGVIPSLSDLRKSPKNKEAEEEHITTLRLAIQAARLLRDRQSLNESIRYYRIALRIQRTFSGTISMKTTSILYELILVHFEQKNSREALNIYNQLLEIKLTLEEQMQQSEGKAPEDLPGVNDFVAYAAFLVGHLCHNENPKPLKVATDEWFKYANLSPKIGRYFRVSKYGVISDAMILGIRIFGDDREIRIVSYSIGESSQTLILLIVFDGTYVLQMRYFCYSSCSLLALLVIPFLLLYLKHVKRAKYTPI